MTDRQRTGPERTADAKRQFEAPGADTWVATASAAGVAHLVPLSFAWDGRDFTIAAEASSLTVRNIRASGRARLGFGPTRDVILVDATLESASDLETVPPSLADAYARQADWDPRREPGAYMYLVLRPRRIQTWREANELDGRTVMQDGAWLF